MRFYKNRTLYFAMLFMLFVISSNGFIQLVKDGGARPQGVENSIAYSGPLNYIAHLWMVIFLVLAASNWLKGRKRISFERGFEFVLWGGLLVSCFASDYVTVSLGKFALMLFAYRFIVSYFNAYGAEIFLNDLRAVFSIFIFGSYVAIFLFPNYGLAIGFDHEGRWQGVFDHKNGLANFMALAALVFLCDVILRRRASSLFWMILSVLLIIKAESTTSIMAFFLIAVVMIFMAPLGSRFYRNFGPSLTIAFSLALVMSSVFVVYIALQSSSFGVLEKDTSFTGRNGIWLYVLTKIVDSPIFGHGLGSFSKNAVMDAADFYNNAGVIFYSSHNGYVDLVYSLGVVGLVFFVSLLFVFSGKVKTRDGFYFYLALVAYALILNNFESRLIDFNSYILSLFVFLRITALQRLSNDIQR